MTTKTLANFITNTQGGDEDNIKADALKMGAESVKSPRIRGKKGKKFADTDFMLALVDQVNQKHEQKINQFQERESEKLKILAIRSKSKSIKKESKSDKIEKTKAILRNKKGKKGKGVGGKGDHRNFDTDSSTKSSKHVSLGKRNGKHSSSLSKKPIDKKSVKTKKKVSFKK